MIVETILTVVMLIVSIYSDRKTNLIKNVIPLTGIILGFVCSMFNNNNIIHSFLMGLVLFLLLFFIPRLLHLNEFMGAGDVKLFMAITFLMGSKVLVYTFLYFAFIGCACLLVLNRRRIDYIFMNVFHLFKNRKLYSEVIDSQSPNILSPYIFLGFIAAYIQLFILNNDWLFIMIMESETTTMLKSLFT
jgi:Flp pilus assembly protein protease CpaA